MVPHAVHKPHLGTISQVKNMLKSLAICCLFVTFITCIKRYMSYFHVYMVDLCMYKSLEFSYFHMPFYLHLTRMKQNMFHIRCVYLYLCATHIYLIKISRKSTIQPLLIKPYTKKITKWHALLLEQQQIIQPQKIKRSRLGKFLDILKQCRKLPCQEYF